MLAPLALRLTALWLGLGAVVLWLSGFLGLLGVLLGAKGYGLVDLPAIVFGFVLGAIIWSSARAAWRTARRV